ncbi:fibronectin type III domain-containing protein [Ulvibacter antarcticus]|uniref:Fibronectin type-III domain-containing protein n=1 Tax=Ulvibacter antarcticus TaxID=442714 RepID=A0A3L9Z2W8_9FLAO|nr:fibronectin type III domain-containing protein [Ulvibacter antarcticus]RMA65769.1 hypothetical protein BXY75_0182 [Ulvibacter antarcticus]
MKKYLLLVCAILVLVSCNKDDEGSNSNCSGPTTIDAILLTSTSLSFEWDTSTGTAWQFEYGPTGFDLGTGTVISTSEEDFLITGLTPLTAYTVHLRNNCGSNGFSDYISYDFTTLQTVVNCNKPTNLTLGLITSNSVAFSWNENNETAWEIKFGVSPYVPDANPGFPTSQSSYNLTGLSPSTTYEIYVRANCGSGGYSEYSLALVVTTNP